MKKLTLFLFLLVSLITNAQQEYKPTEQFTVTGDIKNTITFSLKDAANYSAHSVDSFIIYNHLMERRRVIWNIKGILLKDILGKAVLNEESAKFFSEFYFTCISTDGYKVVYSWNEIFNTEVGNQVMIVTSKEEKRANGGNENILIMSPLDKATGRRFVKNLLEIRVERVK